MIEKFKIPMVVRQKGEIDDTLKVYFESRVIKYIKEMKEKTQTDARYAVLVGNIQDIDDEEGIVISGVIKCNCKDIQNLDEYFLKQMKGYISSQVDRYFPNKKIMGIVCIDKNEINKEDVVTKEFNKIFKEDRNLLFIQNKHSEEISYKINDKVEGLKGYFVYYEKNDEMKKYSEENEIEICVNKEANSFSDEGYKLPITPKIKMSNVASMVNVSLFLLCIVLGLGLIKNLELTRKLENKLKVMNLNLDVSHDENYLVNNNIDDQQKILEEPNLKENNETVEEVLLENKMSIIDDKDEEVIKEAENNKELEKIEKNKEIETVELNENTELMEVNTFKNYKSYDVKKGDTLRGISRKFFGTDEMATNIKELNGLSNGNLIKVGQTLMIPEAY